jgi:two-component system chemotaxis response regulator CheY
MQPQHIERPHASYDIRRRRAHSVLVRTDRPDAVVLDLLMPVMDGWGFIERSRESTHGEPIPIVVMSAAGAIPRSAYEMGVRRFLPKPFMPHDLTEALDEVSGHISGAS